MDLTKIEPEVREALAGSLALHWLALEWYRAAAVCFKRQGYNVLAAHFAEEVGDEGIHANRLLERLAWYDEEPPFSHPETPTIPVYPAEAIRAAVAIEKEAMVFERASVVACRSAGDEDSAVAVAANLAGTNESIRQLTAWLAQEDAMGIENFLALLAGG